MFRVPFDLCRWSLAGLLLQLVLPAAAAEVIRVGVYSNPPLSISISGQPPRGFIIDLLDYIAAREQWQLDYVPCNWERCNELLTLGDIDMLSPISANEAREREYDFNRESLYVNWGQLVTEQGRELTSPLDLDGRTVVALSSDVHFADLKELAQRFDIDVRFFEVEDYESVLAWVAAGPADTGLVNRSFDITKYPTYPVETSGFIFNPAEIRIALSPRSDQLRNALLIQQLDRHLSRLKGDRNSLYYQLQRRWFGERIEGNIPAWVYWLFAFIAGIALLLAAGVMLLRSQVRQQTQHIREINARFSAFMENLPGIAYMKGPDGRYLFVNPNWEQTYHLQGSEVIGRLPEEIWPNHELESHMPEERQALQQQTQIETTETSPWDEAGRIWRLIRFPITDSSDGRRMIGGIGLDISEQRQTEEQLSRLNRQLQLLLDSAGEGIFGLDGLGRCTLVNRAALDLLGYSHAEMLGSNVHDLIQHSYPDGGNYPEVETAICRAIRQGKKSRVRDEVFWHADGIAFPVEYSVHPIAGGEFPGAVVVFRKLSTPAVTN